MNKKFVAVMVGLTIGFVSIHTYAQQFDVQFRGSPNGQGWLVQSVDAGGAATRIRSSSVSDLVGALEADDLIIAINGMPVASVAQYQQAISSLVTTNGRVRLTLRDVRTGIVSDWTYVAASVNPSNPSSATPTPPSSGLAKYELKIQGSIVAGKGLQVTIVTPGGPATRLQSTTSSNIAALETGDVITAINGRSIASPADYQAAMESLAVTGGRAQIDLIDVRTGLVSQYITQADIASGSTTGTNPGNSTAQNSGTINVAGKIHVLLIGMSATSSNGFNESVSQSIAQLGTVVSQIPQSKIASNRSLVGDKCTAQNIVSSIDALNVGSNDSVFVFYIGHGAHDSTQGHFFDFDGVQPDLPRTAVSNALANKRPRLSVLVTESCNQLGTAEALYGRSFEGRDRSTRSAIEILLSDYRGVIDVNSTSRGELGWGTSQTGGFFTSAMTTLLQSDTVQDWNSLITDAGKQANQKFLSMKSGQLQKINNDPTALSDPEKIDLKQKLESQTGMTPEIYQLTVVRN